MRLYNPKAEAQDLVLSLYYKLPNNGLLYEGINSCDSRYKEALMCAKFTTERILDVLGSQSTQSTNNSEEIEHFKQVLEEIEKLNELNKTKKP